MVVYMGLRMGRRDMRSGVEDGEWGYAESLWCIENKTHVSVSNTCSIQG